MRVLMSRACCPLASSAGRGLMGAGKSDDENFVLICRQGQYQPPVRSQLQIDSPVTQHAFLLHIPYKIGRELAQLCDSSAYRVLNQFPNTPFRGSEPCEQEGYRLIEQYRERILSTSSINALFVARKQLFWDIL